MSAFDECPNASHFTFPYYFDSDKGICFQGIDYFFGDLLIYYDGSNFIDCWCSRWDVQNYNIIIETWLRKSDANTLQDNIVPGAVGELYTILGRPTYYDKTWSAGNTITFKPNKYTKKVGSNLSGDNQSTLDKMRNETVVYVKNITTHPLGNCDWIETKLECSISGNQSL